MRDFTLYLHEVDSIEFNGSQSRYGQTTYGGEWKKAWDAYVDHINSASSLIGKDLREFALAQWRQDPRNPHCLRNKIVEKLNFFGTDEVVEVRIRNDVIGRSLAINYSDLLIFSWIGAAPTVAVRDVGEEDENIKISVMRYEELRFEGDVIEHEMCFLDKSRLLVRAKKCSLNLSEYLIN